jgi:hypothetical protein
MRQVLAGAAMTAVLFGGAGFAYSSTRSGGVTPAQFAALKSRVAKLEKTDKALVGYVGGCLLDWKGITQYGDGQNFGYVYDNNNNPADGQFLASALDFTTAGDQTSDYVPATTDAGCTGAATRFGLHAARATTARVALRGAFVRRNLSPYDLK